MNKFLILPCSALLFAGCASNSTKSASTVKWNSLSHDTTGLHGDAGYSVQPQWQNVALAPPGEPAGQGGTGAGPVATDTLSGRGTPAPIPAAASLTTETTSETAEQANIELYKEELVVGKREISNGGVLVRRVVQTENASQPVELRREEYVIERIAAPKDTDASLSSQAFRENEIYIPLTREEAVASKRVLLTENIQIGKRVDTDRVTVTRPVRSETVEVVKVAAKASAAAAATAASADSASSTDSAADSGSMKLAREELVVGKRSIDNGGVRLQKVIHSQDASQGVDLKREEFTLVRQPLNGQVVESARFNPREIRIYLTREEAVPTTRGYLAETVRVRKQVHTDKQVVSGTVRWESIEIAKNVTQTNTVATISRSNELGQGGTGMAGQTGVSTASGSGAASQSEATAASTTTIQDLALTAQVQAALARGFSAKTEVSAGTDYSNITATTLNGVVTLTGTVKTEAEKQLVGMEVSAIDGVRSVQNDLRLADSAK